ncbi:hypothetical protein L1887_18639 [Cichorium endivia]|nr:hypothetical protein L1887_18639 [Cichorium endivia]
MLHTEPSFSVYADEGGPLDNRKSDLKVKIGSGEFSFAETMGLSVENHEDDPLIGFKNLGILQNEDEQIEPERINNADFKSFDENSDVEVNYKNMLDEDPSNPVLLKNYARLLQSNGDLNGAEEYYFRATMADPKDGEILMQYAKLVWELHRDQDRAMGYFESAVNAAPEDCNVLAAYARFLWEIDEDEESDEATALGVNDVGQSDNDLEKYYKRMVYENSSDPLHLANYARFLQQTKGDLKGAESYYLRAIQAGPDNGDSKVVSQYAQLVWELHRDQEKANGYFEQSVKASPTDSHVLAAYAKFLWEVEDED